MKIAEIYRSVQGEGRLTGTESVFVRTSGCNLRCWYCDTPYTSWNPEGNDLSVQSILAQVAEWEARHVVITGGEPMLFAELIPLTESLKSAGYHITIETAGTLYLPVVCDLMSISPKLSNSTPCHDASWARRHDTTRFQPRVIRQLIAKYFYQFKFVVNARSDCEEVAAYLADFPEVADSQVMLMPQGTEAEALDATGEWLEQVCDQRGWQFCPRRQIEWFGLARGT